MLKKGTHSPFGLVKTSEMLTEMGFGEPLISTSCLHLSIPMITGFLFEVTVALSCNK